MKTTTLLLVALCALLGAGLANAQPVARQTTYAFIRCESPRGQPGFCPADTRRGVRIANDLSGRCQLGRTWGYRRDGVWVSGGCAGEFEIGRFGDDYGYGYGYTSDRYVVCASESYQRTFCPTPTARGVRLVNQISDSPCVRGRSWWRDARGIVVTAGCAGEFEVGYRGDDYEWPPATGGGGIVRPNTLYCESRDYRRRYCPADISYGAASLVRRTSQAPCVYGRNWAYDQRGIWVQDGCAGEFEIGYANDAYRPPSGSGWVRCESRDYQQSTCSAPGNRGVRLARQVSRAVCIEGRTWGYDRNRIWVNNGCGADFEVVGRAY
jgi:hypothetical protein